MKLFVKAIVCVLFLGLSACTGATRMHNATIKKRHAQFGIHELPQAWSKKSFRGADLYIEHKSKTAAIFFHAQCEKFSDSPLEALTAQLLVGMGKYEIIGETRPIISGREALVTELDITLDGVKRYLKIMVLRKNRCVFDAVYSAPLKNELAVDFDEIIKTFWAEADE